MKTYKELHAEWMKANDGSEFAEFMYNHAFRNCKPKEEAMKDIRQVGKNEASIFFYNTSKEIMTEFDYSEFKNTHPTLHESIIEAMKRYGEHLLHYHVR